MLEKCCLDALEDSFFPARLSAFIAEVWQQEGWGAAECLCSPRSFALLLPVATNGHQPQGSEWNSMRAKASLYSLPIARCDGIF